MVIEGLLSLALFILGIWMGVRVLRKAGYSGLWAILLIIPVVNLIAVWVFAWSRWPRVPEPPV